MRFIISVLICLIFLYIILNKYIKYNDVNEGFALVQTTIRNSPDKIYDSFYANIYDDLLKSDIKNEFECLIIHKDFIKNTKNPKILDLGCGTGQHLRILSRYNHNLVGLDSSKYMLKCVKSKIKSKNIELKLGDFHQLSLFKKRTFTHILCLFYTIYLAKNITLFFKNCNTWLKPKGIIFIHVINRDKFDPILETSSSLIPFFDPQKHSNNRKTETILHFNKFEYITNWKFYKSYSIFSEKFKFKNKPMIRINNHKLIFYSQSYIKQIAKKEGFELIKIIDMMTIGFSYNYILCFQKKYGR